MEKRKLGNSGVEVQPLALGGNVFGWTADESASFKVLDGFVAADFNLINSPRPSRCCSSLSCFSP